MKKIGIIFRAVVGVWMIWAFICLFMMAYYGDHGKELSGKAQDTFNKQLVVISSQFDAVFDRDDKRKVILQKQQDSLEKERHSLESESSKSFQQGDIWLKRSYLNF
ncbi:MAG: hypothetical protein ABIO57_04010 [Candidatus Paceibacterota bacterium]